jgi:hypothetical protein
MTVEIGTHTHFDAVYMFHENETRRLPLELTKPCRNDCPNIRPVA